MRLISVVVVTALTSAGLVLLPPVAVSAAPGSDIVWINEGPGDGFENVADPAEARAIVGEAIAAWNEVIVAFRYPTRSANTFELTLTVGDTQSLCGSPSGCGLPTRFDQGVPYAGEVFLAEKREWVLIPGDQLWRFSIVADPFAADAALGTPFQDDLFTLALHEIGHALGISSGSPLLQNRLVADPSGFQRLNGNGFTAWFDGGHLARSRHQWDLMAPSPSSVRPDSSTARRLITDLDALILDDVFGHTVTRPSKLGTFLAVFDPTRGDLRMVTLASPGLSSAHVRPAGSAIEIAVGPYMDRFTAASIRTFRVDGSTAVDHIELITVPPAIVTVKPGPGDDEVRVHAAPQGAQVVIDGVATDGNDHVIIGNSGGSIADIVGDITVRTNAPSRGTTGVGQDLLEVIDTGASDPRSWTVEPTRSIQAAGLGRISHANLFNVFVQGGSHDDSITLANSGSGNGTALNFDAGSGDDAIIGPETTILWTVEPNHVQVGADVHFYSIGQLQGGGRVDTFTVSGVGGLPALAGGDGIDRVDYSQMTSAVTADLRRLTQIEELVGGPEPDTLVGVDTPTTWELTGPGTGRSGNVEFASFENLTGGVADDSFVLSDSVSWPGQLDGDGGLDTLDWSNWTSPVSVSLAARTATGVPAGWHSIETVIGSTGNDTLSGPSNPTTWSIDGPGRGSVATVLPIVAFRSFEAIAGGSEVDTFTFAGGATVDSVDGGDADDILDLSAWTTPVTVDLASGTATIAPSGLTSVERFHGGQSTDTLRGPNLPNVWHLNSPDAGSIGIGTRFASFEHLAGGSLADRFVFERDGVTIASLDGAAGEDRIEYPAAVNGVTVDLFVGRATGVAGKIVDIEGAFGGPADDWLYGDTGSNLLWGRGGNDLLDGRPGADILLGGNGDDQIAGGDHRDVIGAGIGADTVSGRADDDLLISGRTTYEDDIDAWRAIAAEWRYTGRSYNARVRALRDGTGLNLTYTLTPSTVLGDFDADRLIGDTGTDWFWADPIDSIIDRAASEQLN